MAQNVAYGLSGKRAHRKHVAGRVEEMLTLVGLAGAANKYPGQISGGQQQRVALARALAPSPSLLLLDEPMSALDARVREHLRIELRALQKRLSITTLMVTHDQEEAMVMADRIAVMNGGVIEQFGTPRELYRQPGSAFIADFVGEANWLPFERIDAHRARVGRQELAVDEALGAASGRLFVRPEAVRASAPCGRNSPTPCWPTCSTACSWAEATAWPCAWKACPAPPCIPSCPRNRRRPAGPSRRQPLLGGAAAPCDSRLRLTRVPRRRRRRARRREPAAPDAGAPVTPAASFPALAAALPRWAGPPAWAWGRRAGAGAGVVPGAAAARHPDRP